MSENISCVDAMTSRIKPIEPNPSQNRDDSVFVVPKDGVLFSSSKMNGWGGPRPNSGGTRANSGGPRPNSGGARPNSGPKPKPKPVIIQENLEDTERWYCVRALFGKDLTADIELRLAGYTVFAPTVWKAATKSRRDANGVVRPGKPDRIEPLFRSYLFTRFYKSDPSWRHILSLPGVDRIISSTPENPIPVPDRAIEIVQSFLAPNGCYYPGAEGLKLSAIAPGTKVKLESGPMANLVGICEKSDGKRIQVLLEILGRSVSVTTKQASVEVIR